MTAKTLNLLYWIFTILFAGLMIFSAVGGIQPNADTLKMMHDGMGYPIYFIQFISIAKVIGALVLLIPGLYRIKEWAYAGLFIDLAGAIFSLIASFGFSPQMLGMLIWVIMGVLSYYFWHKKIGR